MTMEHLGGSSPREGRVPPAVVEGALRAQVREEGGSVDPVFEGVVQEGIDAALAAIKMRFEQAENPEDNLDFHNTKHTNEVIKRTQKLLEAMKVDARRVMLGRLIAAYHDTIQHYTKDASRGGGVEMRKRDIGNNEVASAQELIAFFENNNDVFTDEDREIVRSAIENTIPDWDPANKTVMQKKMMEKIDASLESPLTPDSPALVERAVALADLGTAGMNGPEVYLPEGNAIFREENLDIPERLKDPMQHESLKKRMLGWSAMQIAFAEGRKARLDTELKGLPNDMAKHLREDIFNRFDDSIAAAIAQHALRVREEMSFEDLAKSFGYTPPKYTLQ